MTGVSDRPSEQDAASASTDFDRRLDMAYDVARTFIRSEYDKNGCVIGIWELLEHLDEVFGEQAGITSDVPTVLGLCVDLWEDPHIDQVPDGWIDFCWNEKGHWPRENDGPQDLRTRLLHLNDQGDHP